jgi:hypothetical protein
MTSEEEESVRTLSEEVEERLEAIENSSRQLDQWRDEQLNKNRLFWDGKTRRVESVVLLLHVAFLRRIPSTSGELLDVSHPNRSIRVHSTRRDERTNQSTIEMRPIPRPTASSLRFPGHIERRRTIASGLDSLSLDLSVTHSDPAERRFPARRATTKRRRATDRTTATLLYTGSNSPSRRRNVIHSFSPRVILSPFATGNLLREFLFRFENS